MTHFSRSHENSKLNNRVRFSSEFGVEEIQISLFSSTTVTDEHTLGNAYNEFGYNDHLDITQNFFFSPKRTLLIDINVKKSLVTTSTTSNKQVFAKQVIRF